METSDVREECRQQIATIIFFELVFCAPDDRLGMRSNYLPPVNCEKSFQIGERGKEKKKNWAKS